jgi:hypothetical protein
MQKYQRQLSYLPWLLGRCSNWKRLYLHRESTLVSRNTSTVTNFHSSDKIIICSSLKRLPFVLQVILNHLVHSNALTVYFGSLYVYNASVLCVLCTMCTLYASTNRSAEESRLTLCIQTRVHPLHSSSILDWRIKRGSSFMRRSIGNDDTKFYTMRCRTSSTRTISTWMMPPMLHLSLDKSELTKYFAANYVLVSFSVCMSSDLYSIWKLESIIRASTEQVS